MTTGEILYLMLPICGALTFAMVFGYLTANSR